jgi:hypothetical protein
MNLPSYYSIYLFKALENEIELDLNIRKKFFSNSCFKSLPNGKLMKQVAWKAKLKFFYWPFIFILILIIPVRNLFLSIFTFLLFPRKKIFEQKSHVYVFATSKSNKSIISDALKSNFLIDKKSKIDFDFLSIRRLSKELNTRELFNAFRSFAYLYYLFLKQPRRRMLELILHSFDSFKLILLLHFIEKRPDDVFVTEDHYQRWAFLISNHTKNLYIVQHGFLDLKIEFKHSFGSIRWLFLRDVKFLECFEQYYKVHNFKVFSLTSDFISLDISDSAILLASSYPSIDVEIEFLKELKKNCCNPIIIKLHPNHDYDARKDILLSYATIISGKDQNILSKYFISYNSFLEYAYKQNNVYSYSLEKLGIELTIQKLTESLHN